MGVPQDSLRGRAIPLARIVVRVVLDSYFGIAFLLQYLISLTLTNNTKAERASPLALDSWGLE